MLYLFPFDKGDSTFYYFDEIIEFIFNKMGLKKRLCIFFGSY